MQKAQKFLSTPSGWRATPLFNFGGIRNGGISIHALRVEGDIINAREASDDLEISIHALRVEGDVPRIQFIQRLA